MTKSKFVFVGTLVAVLLGYSTAQASGIFIPPRPPSIKKPGETKCEPADSEKCKKEVKEAEDKKGK